MNSNHLQFEYFLILQLSTVVREDWGYKCPIIKEVFEKSTKKSILQNANDQGDNVLMVKERENNRGKFISI